MTFRRVRLIGGLRFVLFGFVAGHTAFPFPLGDVI